MVAEKCGFTRPWFDLTKKDILRYRADALNNHEQLQNMFPADILSDVEGKDVLCLASGGGQQSAVFGLLGAQVTVVDFSEKQLDGDRKAAAHYGYEVTTIQTDMRDLSGSADGCLPGALHGLYPRCGGSLRGGGQSIENRGVLPGGAY